ncbi:MAG: UbiD family decarboxylase [TACK group archaeon]|nr:UbiD family decarboxylase [TACK group archaeon]
MTFHDLRAYLEELRHRGLVKDVKGADWDVEIGAISAMIARSAKPRALLFDAVKGYNKGLRVATNLYISREMQSLALSWPSGMREMELVDFWRRKLRDLKPLKPREVSDGPIKENELKGEEVDLLSFPIPRWHEEDAGRYLAGGAVILRDPDDGWVNVGVYRAMVHDGKTLGLMISPGHDGLTIIRKYWNMGKAAPVAVLGAQDPLTFYAGATAFPWRQQELDLAGGLAGRPMDVIIDQETQLPIPSGAEMAIFGEVPPSEMVDEGPFGECAGYYTHKGPSPIIRVKKIWHRNDPIIQGNPPLYEGGSPFKGSSDSYSLGSQITVSALAWNSLESLGIEVAGVYSLVQPCMTPSVLIISLRNPTRGAVTRAAAAALAMGGMMRKAVVVVDDGVDPSDVYQVLFAVATRCDPALDVQVIKDVTTSSLDPSVPSEIRGGGHPTGSCAIVDATIKTYTPRPITVSDKLMTALKKWERLLEDD